MEETRGIKEILALFILYLEDKNTAPIAGLCELGQSMYNRQKLTLEELILFNEFIHTHKPKTNTNYAQGAGYFWEPWERKLRLRWLKLQISNLRTLKRLKSIYG